MIPSSMQGQQQQFHQFKMHQPVPQSQQSSQPPQQSFFISTPNPPQQVRGNANKVQGLYSSYPTRLRESLDNALLLPSSYLNNKKSRFNDDDGDSEDDFDDFVNDSDTSSRVTGRSSRAAALAASAALTAGGGNSLSTRNRSMNDSTDINTINNMNDDKQNTMTNINGTGIIKNKYLSSRHKPIPIGVAKDNLNLPKTLHVKNQIYPKQEDIEKAATITEVLVPIRLDIDIDDIKLRDVFLWNMHEQFLTPEKFGEMLCQDIDLETSKFVPIIAESIRQQVIDFESIHEIELPLESQTRVTIDLDLQVGKVNLRDRFEWDLSNVSTNGPELFSKQMAAELGLGGEYVTIISHAIREQLYKHKRQLVEDYGSDQISLEPLTSAYRRLENIKAWSPQLELLSNEELEKLLIAQERNIRRLRRENRFKRSRRRGSVPPRRTGTPS